MYEVGYAKAIERDVILVAHTAEDLPFDLHIDRTITYGRSSPEEVRSQVTASLRDIRNSTTPPASGYGH